MAPTLDVPVLFSAFTGLREKRANLWSDEETEINYLRIDHFKYDLFNP